MNSTQAKQIRIVDFLKISDSKNEFFIKSPFNPNEKTPSFKINANKNIWYDHARGIGGNIIDLVMQLNNCSFSQALQILETQTSFSFSPAKAKTKETKEIEIKKIQDLQNAALIDYLKKRKIDIDIAKIYLKEIYYFQNKKNYFSLSFLNDSGGYETRNPYFKGCIGKKDITSIKSSNSDRVSLFEGFMDFLSALTHYKKDKFQNNVIVLNSISLKNKVILDNYAQIYLFLDNDTAGQETAKFFFNKNKNCIDCSNIYKNYKDFNEMLN